MLLFALAFDHRNSYRTEFFGLRTEPTPQQQERAREGKQVIFEGLLRALADGLPEGRAAVLVDDEYGADVAVNAREAGITVALAIERSGQRELAFERQPFYTSIVALDPDYAKVLVRYNPDAQPELNQRQRAKLTQLQTWIGDNGKELMLELLVPPEPPQLEAADGDRTRYDLEQRPELTIRAVRDLVQNGMAPQLWKLEGMASTSQYESIANEVKASGRSDAGCLVLGRGADPAAVDRWLTLAAPVTGFTGFAVGRTIWWDPLRGYFDGSASHEQAATQIGANYRRLVDVYLAAAAR